MKAFVAGIVVTILCIVGGGYAFLAGGYAPVATDSRPLPFEKRLTGMALHATLRKEMPRTVPIEATEANYLAGARLYLTNCAVCHGAPGQEKTAIALGEFPVPPQLMHGKGVTDDPPGETYWKVANGIRLTGMPGFHQSLSQTQMWQISLLLANANKLPDSVMHVLAGQAEPTAQAPAATPGH
ncbi:MAG TPA: c-type cytochrome [Vicinamibacterales bacterium]|nr:c-type cytochrome [Vicinamibacterales bacterium]